jgi:hypothetical protein
MDKIAYDTKLKRPGCVLLQAAMGCKPEVAHPFEPSTWLIHPTPDLKVYPLTPEILEKLVIMTNTQHNINHLRDQLKEC